MTRTELHALYAELGPAVRARCRAICGNGADADEALQETFLRAWKARGRFDGRHPLAWLQTIARNASLDVLRRRRPWADDPAAWLELPDAVALTADRVDLVRLLDGFSPHDVAILRLRYAEEWRVHEVAEHLGTSRRTVQRRLERLVKRARAVARLPEDGWEHAS
ncbi:MAG: sigma-70 family RNA polymerase sigma factor [Myxococcales bacterium]|nr:sigma-70 family RNA polymerase sigma factor [Myxococcales bacterium]